jgi:ATP-dependent Clp protease ATP-binding subunit ClpA
MGETGIGKTSLIRILAMELYKEYTEEYVLELNNGSWTKEKSSFVVKPVD